MSRASPRSPTRARKPDAGHRSPETVALLPRGDADGDPARGDAAGPLALLARPAGLEARPRRHPEDALGERRPLRTVTCPIDRRALCPAAYGSTIDVVARAARRPL